MIESDKILLTCRQAAGQTSVTLTQDERGDGGVGAEEERKHQRGEVEHSPLPRNSDDDTSITSPQIQQLLLVLWHTSR